MHIEHWYKTELTLVDDDDGTEKTVDVLVGIYDFSGAEPAAWDYPGKAVDFDIGLYDSKGFWRGDWEQFITQEQQWALMDAAYADMQREVEPCH